MHVTGVFILFAPLIWLGFVAQLLQHVERHFGFKLQDVGSSTHTHAHTHTNGCSLFPPPPEHAPAASIHSSAAR